LGRSSLNSVGSALGRGPESSENFLGPVSLNSVGLAQGRGPEMGLGFRQVSKSPRGYPRETRRKCRANIKGLLEGHRTCRANIKGLLEATGRQVSKSPRGYPRETRRKCRANIKGLLEDHRACRSEAHRNIPEETLQKGLQGIQKTFLQDSHHPS